MDSYAETIKRFSNKEYGKLYTDELHCVLKSSIEQSNLLVDQVINLMDGNLYNIRTAYQKLEQSITIYPGNRTAIEYLRSISIIFGYTTVTKSAEEILNTTIQTLFESLTLKILNKSSLYLSSKNDIFHLLITLADSITSSLKIDPSNTDYNEHRKRLEERHLTKHNQPLTPFGKRILPETDIIKWLDLSTSVIYKSPQKAWIPEIDKRKIPQHHHHLITSLSKTSLIPITLAKAEEITISAIRNIGNDDSVQFFPENRNGKILFIRHHVDEPTYIESFLLFDKVTRRDNSTEYVSRADRYNSNFFSLPNCDSFLLGGINNFGHWMLDHVARLATLFAFDSDQLGVDPEKVALVVPPLHSWQRESLSGMGITNPIIEIPNSPGSISIVNCKNLFIGGFVSLANKYLFLRERIRAHHKITHTRTKTRIYVSRSKWDKSRKERIHDSQRVTDFFRNNGFIVIFPEDHSFEQIFEIINSAEIVATDFGSSMFNYFLFSSESAIHISLFPYQLIYNDCGIVNVLFWHLPFISRTIFIEGEALDNSDNDWVNATFKYSDQSLKSGLERAKNMLKSH
jgi:hypothetical protein